MLEFYIVIEFYVTTSAAKLLQLSGFFNLFTFEFKGKHVYILFV